MQFVSKQEQHVLRRATVLLATAVGWCCCCYYAIIVNLCKHGALWLKAEIFWFIFTTIIRLNSQTDSLIAVRNVLQLDLFTETTKNEKLDSAKRCSVCTSTLPPLNCRQGLAANKITSVSLLSHCFHVCFFIHTDRHKQKHSHCCGTFNICAFFTVPEITAHKLHDKSI